MPFKGDMRLGGRHSNVASLNGTASDLDGVPAYGTFLHGPDDTSRTEYDFIGEPYYMPYETNWYADGLGGEYSTETWGLQYFPAEWVTNRVYTPENDDTLTVYPLGGEPCIFTIATVYTDYVEDGTGINYTSDGSQETANEGDFICQDVTLSPYVGFELVDIAGTSVPPYQSFYRYIYDGQGGAESVFADDAKVYYTNGANTGVTVPETFGVVLVEGNEPTLFPTGRTVNYRWDGDGGFYGVATGTYTAAGTLFYTTGAIGTQTPVQVPSGSGDYFDSEVSYGRYYHDGTGGFSYDDNDWEYYPNETFISNDYLPHHVEVPSGSINTFNNGMYDRYEWNGTGGFTTLLSLGSFYPAGTQITLVGEDVPVPEEATYDFFFNGKSTRYNWNGSGGYVSGGLVGSYFANGTFIHTANGVSYYWEGDGSYYTA